MLPEKIADDRCGMARRWVLHPLLASALVDLERLAQKRFATSGIRWPGLWIISGNRTAEAQAVLNPDVSDSLHVRCPALAVDLRVGSIPEAGRDALLDFAGATWLDLGRETGLDYRWGGTFSDFPNRAHFDIGRTV